MITQQISQHSLLIRDILLTRKYNKKSDFINYQSLLRMGTACISKATISPRINDFSCIWYAAYLYYIDCHQHISAPTSIPNINVAYWCFLAADELKWDASSRCSSSLYCLKRKSDEMTIRTHPTLLVNPRYFWYSYMQCNMYNDDHICYI